jgi:hypothetical protein
VLRVVRPYFTYGSICTRNVTESGPPVISVKSSLKSSVIISRGDIITTGPYSIDMELELAHDLSGKKGG